jgi:hypothetical protein
MKDNCVYQFKVSLSDNPPIWRRLLILGSFVFSDFHVAIQDAMQWNDYHLYEFEVKNPVIDKKEIIGICDDEFYCEKETISGMKRSIADIFSLKNKIAQYTYDFGDNWIHHIELEQISAIDKKKNYPLCIQGAGACPPEDCGGLSEYLNHLNTDKKNKLFEDKKELFRLNQIDFKEYAFQAKYIHFREQPSKENFSKEDYQLWMRKLLLGKICLDELKQDLCAKMPYEDIELLYDCALSKPLSFRNRAIGVLSLCKGIPKDIISEYLFISTSMISYNYKRYLSDGVHPVISDKGKRPLKHQDQNNIDKIFSILHSPPSSFGFNRTTWRQVDIQKVMSDNDMPISKHVLKKIIDNSGYKYRKAKTVLTSNDPDYKEKIQAIKGILSNLGPREKFFSIDEYGPFAIKIQGGRSLVPPGTTKIVPQWQKSKGSIIITAALELSTNQITHFYSDKKNTTEMIKLLNLLVEQYSDEKCIYFSWDAASWHASKELYKRVDEINAEEFKAKNRTPIVKLAPLPTCAQFLNVIESVFSGMARAIIHNSDYKSIVECKYATDRYFAERNAYYQNNPKRAGNKIWGKERVKVSFSESNNCKDPKYR